MPRKVQPYGSGDDAEAAALARSRPNTAPRYVNDLAVLTLRHQEPGELLAQLGQLVAHQRQPADNLASVARTG